MMPDGIKINLSKTWNAFYLLEQRLISLPRKFVIHKFAIQEVVKAAIFLLTKDVTNAQQMLFSAYNRIQENTPIIYYRFYSKTNCKEYVHGIPEMCDPKDYSIGWFHSFQIGNITKMNDDEVKEFLNKW